MRSCSQAAILASLFSYHLSIRRFLFTFEISLSVFTAIGASWCLDPYLSVIVSVSLGLSLRGRDVGSNTQRFRFS